MKSWSDYAIIMTSRNVGLYSFQRKGTLLYGGCGLSTIETWVGGMGVVEKKLMTSLLSGRATVEWRGRGGPADSQALESEEKRWAVNTSANECHSHCLAMSAPQ